jgi:hypothetical protein
VLLLSFFPALNAFSSAPMAREKTISTFLTLRKINVGRASALSR